ncbi:MAG: L,D-transpeptidase [Pseudomonadota bacterium]
MINRRNILCAASLMPLAGCVSLPRQDYQPLRLFAESPDGPMPLHYGPLPLEQFPVPAVPPGVVEKKYWRRRTISPFTQFAPGTIIVDPQSYYLYLIEPGETAMRYGIGVGRQGFAWSGNATIALKRQWPRWKAPASMIARRPDLEPYSVANGGMAPGLNNPLGARALYLFHNGVDTLYRIHGTPEARSIGRAVSSGCIRMLNHDVIDLYGRVPIGASVIVRQAQLPPQLA